MFLFQRRNRVLSTSRRIRASARFRPCVDGLEGRALLSSMAVSVTGVTGVTAAQATPTQIFQALPNGQLLATVTLASRPVTVPVTPTILTTSGTNRTLMLRVGPIDQTAMGLRVHIDPFNAIITPQGTQSLPLGTLLTGTTTPTPADLAQSLNSTISQLASTNPQAGTGSLLSLDRLSIQGGQLVATGTFAGQPFNRAVALGTSAGTSPRRPNLTLTLPASDTVQQGLRIQTESIPIIVSSPPGRATQTSNLLGSVSRLISRNANLSPRQLSQLNRLLARL